MATKKEVASKPKGTRFIRVKLDYVLFYGEDINSLPPGFSNPDINRLILKGTEVFRGSRDALAIMPGARLDVGLYYPKVKKKE